MLPVPLPLLLLMSLSTQEAVAQAGQLPSGWPGPQMSTEQALRYVDDLRLAGGVWEAVPFLRSPEPQVVIEAAWVLAEIGDGEVVRLLEQGPRPPLAGRAEAEEVALHMAAAAKLLNLLADEKTPPAAFAALLEEARKSRIGRSRQLRIMARHKHPALTEGLYIAYQRAKEQRTGEEWGPAMALVQRDDPRAVDAIPQAVARLRYGGVADPEIAELAARYWRLSTAGKPEDEKLALMLENLQAGNSLCGAESLVDAGAKGQQLLLEFVRNANEATRPRCQAAIALGSADAAQAVPVLAGILSDRKEASDLRHAAADGLVRCGTPEAIEALAGRVMAQDDDPGLVADVLALLKYSAGPSVLAAVVRHLQHPSAVVRMRAAGVLVKLPSPDKLDPLEEAMAVEQDPAVQMALGVAIARSSQYWDDERLLRYISHVRWEVREEAAYQWGKRGLSDEAEKALREQIPRETEEELRQETAKHPFPPPLLTQVHALLKWRGEKALQEVRAALEAAGPDRLKVFDETAERVRRTGRPWPGRGTED